MKKAKLTIIFSLVFLFLSNMSAFAVDTSQKLNLPSNTDPQIQEMPGVFSLLAKLIISLIIIAVLAYLTIKFLRRNLQTKSSGDSINILDQHAFGLNKGIFIAEIGNRVYVLGVTDHNISLVTEISDPQIISEMRAKAMEREMEPVVPAGLASIAKNFIGNLRNSKLKAKSNKDFKSHIQSQVNKLQEMFDAGREEGKNE